MTLQERQAARERWDEINRPVSDDFFDMMRHARDFAAVVDALPLTLDQLDADDALLREVVAHHTHTTMYNEHVYPCLCGKYNCVDSLDRCEGTCVWGRIRKRLEGETA